MVKVVEEAVVESDDAMGLVPEDLAVVLVDIFEVEDVLLLFLKENFPAFASSIVMFVDTDSCSSSSIVVVKFGIVSTTGSSFVFGLGAGGFTVGFLVGGDVSGAAVLGSTKCSG